MRILAYVEPHPIRNDHVQFAHVGRLFARALLNASRWDEFEFRLFANDSVAERLAGDFPQIAPFLLRPTAQETAAIQAFDQTWNERAIAAWLDLVNGRDAITDLYVNILRRLHGTFSFDVILLWSENGAVKIAARELGATTIHGELGPTRAPFPPTVYFDVRGTNGNASVTRAPLSIIQSTQVVPTETWLTEAPRKPTTAVGVVESGVLWPSAAIAARLPRSSFVFIPMQLADDLNTLCHSSHKSPSDFLERVVPTFLDQGLEVVLKGHPGVAGRSYNLRMEVQALARAQELDSRVTVLPRDINASDTLAIVAQSQCVCSINSSVGFEAMLLGKGCSLLGAAAYDWQGRIRRRGLEVERTDEQREWDSRLVSFLMGHYFLPINDVLSGEALLLAIRLIQREQQRRGDFEAEFWTEWVQSMAFGWREIVPSTPGESSTQRPLTTLVEGLTYVFDGELYEADDCVKVQLVLPGRTVRFDTVRVDNHFIGHVDEISESGNGFRLRGWAFQTERMVAPILLLVASGTTVIASVPLTTSRPDVAAYLENAAAEQCGFDAEFAFGAGTDGLRLFFLSDQHVIQEVAWQTGPLPG